MAQTRKIRVTYYTESTGCGGCENHLVELIDNVGSPEFDISLILLSHREHREETGILLDKVHQLVSSGKINTFQHLEAKNVGILLLGDLRTTKKLWRSLSIESSILHLYKASMGRCAVPMFMARALQKPSIQTLQLPPRGRRRWWSPLQEWRNSLYLKLPDLTITVSETFRQECISHYRVRPEKIITIRNGVNIENFKRVNVAPERKRALLEQELGVGLQGKIIFLNVARLDEQKGHQFLVEAISHIQRTRLEDYGKILVLCAGSGALEASIRDMVRQYGVSESIAFLGYRADINELLAACDAFILTSLYEGLPLTIIEAMAMSKPVIATAVDGTAETVLHGDTGYLVKPGDPFAIADALVKFLKAPLEERLRLGQNGYSRAVNEFDHAKQSQKVKEIYRNLWNARCAN